MISLKCPIKSRLSCWERKISPCSQKEKQVVRVPLNYHVVYHLKFSVDDLVEGPVLFDLLGDSFVFTVSALASNVLYLYLNPL